MDIWMLCICSCTRIAWRYGGDQSIMEKQLQLLTGTKKGIQPDLRISKEDIGRQVLIYNWQTRGKNGKNCNSLSSKPGCKCPPTYLDLEFQSLLRSIHFKYSPKKCLDFPNSMDLLMATLPASTSSVMPFTETMRCPCDMALHVFHRWTIWKLRISTAAYLS